MMKSNTKVCAFLLVVLLAVAFLAFRSANRSLPLTTSETNFIGTWSTEPTGNRIEFKSNRRFTDGELSGSWRIVNGTIFIKTWREAPQRFDYKIANRISKPILNAWDSMTSEEILLKLVVIDESTAKIDTGDGDWEVWVKSK